MDACNDEVLEYTSSRWSFVWPRNKDLFSISATSPVAMSQHHGHSHGPSHVQQVASGQAPPQQPMIPLRTPTSRQQLKQTLNPFRLNSRTTTIERTVKLFAKSTSYTCARMWDSSAASQCAGSDVLWCTSRRYSSVPRTSYSLLVHRQ